jgi:hypothetical protein
MHGGQRVALTAAERGRHPEGWLRVITGLAIARGV